MMNTFLTLICCVKLLTFLPSTRSMDIDLYPQLDERLTEVPQYPGLLSPNELKLPGIFIIIILDLSWRQPVFAKFDDRNNALEVDDGPSKEPHEPHKYGLTDETIQELEHVNDDYKVSYSDLTDDEFIRSLFEDKNDMNVDGLSREISYFMDNHSKDSTIDTLDQSKEKETTSNAGNLQNTILDNEEISNLGYKGILIEFNH